MAELDEILAAERRKLETDPSGYPDTGRAVGLHAQRIAVALEQDDALLRRLLRYLHRPDSSTLLVEHTEDGPVSNTPSCASCYEPDPCTTRLVVDGDEEAIASLLAFMEENPDQEAPHV